VVEPRAETHWDSPKGLIQSAAVRDGQGRRRHQIPWGEAIEIRIEVRIPPDNPRDHLSIAFSIKDLRGNGLILSTTQDFECSHLPEQELFVATFRFIKPLAIGDYLLVAAVEDRHLRDIYYYEML
jgi:lipopolysaccharide transport system ATP-binding protein